MADVPTINPTIPLWPTRPDGKRQQPGNRDSSKEDPEEDKHSDEQQRPPDNHDGHIDDYA